MQRTETCRMLRTTFISMVVLAMFSGSGAKSSAATTKEAINLVRGIAEKRISWANLARGFAAKIVATLSGSPEADDTVIEELSIPRDLIARDRKMRQA